MSIPTSKSDYKYTDVSKIPVEGDVIPEREVRDRGRRVLKAEDVAFLDEALEVRGRICKTWPEGTEGNPLIFWGDPGGSITYPMTLAGTPPSLDLAFHGRRVLGEIPKFFHMTFPHNDFLIRNFGGYGAYIDGDISSHVHDQQLDDEWNGWVEAGDWGRIETELLKEMGCDPALFAAKRLNVPDGRYGMLSRLTEPTGLSLDREAVRRGFMDVKRLWRVVVPCATRTPSSCEWEDNAGDWSGEETEYHEARLVVRPLSMAPTFSFPKVDCFCSTPSDNATTSTLYMDEHSYWRHGTGENAKDTMECCAMYVKVHAPDEDVELVPFGDEEAVRTDMLRPERVYLLLRAWQRNPHGSAQGPDYALWLTSWGTSKWSVPRSRTNDKACKKLLSSSGFPTTVSSSLYNTTGQREPHVASVGVEVIGYFVVAALNDPATVRTDLHTHSWTM